MKWESIMKEKSKVTENKWIKLWANFTNTNKCKMRFRDTNK
jgi:hypothetical protein